LSVTSFVAGSAVIDISGVGLPAFDASSADGFRSLQLAVRAVIDIAITHERILNMMISPEEVMNSDSSCVKGREFSRADGGGHGHLEARPGARYPQLEVIF
jgi:hypothetical protein